MNKNLLPVFSSLLFLCFYTGSAQTKIIIHENTTQHQNTPTLKKGSRKRPTNMKDGGAPFFGNSESALKFNISPIFRGDFCLSFEKKVTPDISVEITGGVTYRDALFEDIGDFQNYRPLNMINYRRDNSAGPSVKVGARYYIDAGETEIEGPYVSTEAMFRRYNSAVPVNYSTSSLTKEFNDHREIRALVGWQGSGWYDYAFYDVSAGVGYRMHVRNYVGYVDYYNSTAKLMTGQENYLTFMINLKVGFFLDY